MSAFDVGVTANIEGIPRSDNPYQRPFRDLLRRAAWYRGWEQAERHHRAAMLRKKEFERVHGKSAP